MWINIFWASDVAIRFNNVRVENHENRMQWEKDTKNRPDVKGKSVATNLVKAAMLLSSCTNGFDVATNTFNSTYRSIKTKKLA